MRNHIPKIRAIHRALMRELFTIKASWHYSKVTQAIDLLARLVHDYPMSDDGYEIWSIGGTVSVQVFTTKVWMI